MSLVSESQALAAELFTIGVDLGANEHSVSLSVPGTSTQDTSTGIVEQSDPEVTTFPTALVQIVSLERVAKSGGALEEGDLIVTQLPRSDDNDALVIRPDATWTVTGPGITGTKFLMRRAKPDLLEWVITLKRAGL